MQGFYLSHLINATKEWDPPCTSADSGHPIPREARVCGGSEGRRDGRPRRGGAWAQLAYGSYRKPFLLLLKITWGNMDCCHAQLRSFPFLVKDGPSGSGRSEGKVSPWVRRSVGCILQATEFLAGKKNRRIAEFEKAVQTLTFWFSTADS